MSINRTSLWVISAVVLVSVVALIVWQLGPVSQFPVFQDAP